MPNEVMQSLQSPMPQADKQERGPWTRSVPENGFLSRSLDRVHGREKVPPSPLAPCSLTKSSSRCLKREPPRWRFVLVLESGWCYCRDVE